MKLLSFTLVVLSTLCILVIGNSQLKIPTLKIPTYFRAKMRAWMHTSREPTLMVFHYDAQARKTREDYYTLVDMFHKRFMTDIKDYKKGVKHWIFHKQPKSPRMCVMAPIFQPFVDESITNTGVFIGDTTITLSDTNEKVNCQHWRFFYDNQEVEACMLPPSGSKSGSENAKVGKSGLKQIPNFYRPVLVQHPAIRLEVFHFEPIGDELDLINDVEHSPPSLASQKAPPQTSGKQSTPEVAYLESTLNKLSKTKLKQESSNSTASSLTFKGLPAHWAKVFDASKASKARCTAWG